MTRPALILLMLFAPPAAVAEGFDVSGGLEMGLVGTSSGTARRPVYPHAGFDLSVDGSTQLDNGLTIGFTVNLEEDFDPETGTWSIRISGE